MLTNAYNVFSLVFFFYLKKSLIYDKAMADQKADCEITKVWFSSTSCHVMVSHHLYCHHMKFSVDICDPWIDTTNDKCPICFVQKIQWVDGRTQIAISQMIQYHVILLMHIPSLNIFSCEWFSSMTWSTSVVVKQSDHSELWVVMSFLWSTTLYEVLLPMCWFWLCVVRMQYGRGNMKGRGCLCK